MISRIWPYLSLLLNLFLLLYLFSSQELNKSIRMIVDKSFSECPNSSSISKQAPLDSKHQIFETTNVLDCSEKKVAWNTIGVEGNQYGCHLKKRLEWIYSLKTKEKRVFSQNGEDGITEAIFKKIGERTKYFVEFGVQDGTECNTRFLRETYNWTGLLLDNLEVNPAINLHKETVWMDNVVSLFKKYKVPLKFDYLSVDTDFSEFWLTKAILEGGYRPRVVVIEINGNYALYSSLSIPSSAANARGTYKNSRFFGTSALALAKLLDKYGYRAIYVEKSAVNIFFIHKSELHNTDLALAHWIKVISQESKIGKATGPSTPRS